MRDSELTVHGAQQASRLGQHFADQNIGFDIIFSSDLRRAYKTAGALRKCQGKAFGQDVSRIVDVQQLEALREQDFGSYEGQPFSAKPATAKRNGKKALRNQRAELPDFGMSSRGNLSIAA